MQMMAVKVYKNDTFEKMAEELLARSRVPSVIDDRIKSIRDKITQIRKMGTAIEEANNKSSLRGDT